MIEYALKPSRTHERRFYRLTELLTELADALLEIQQGEPGPRGGTSKVDRAAYFLQEEAPDPDEPPMMNYRIFLLAKADGPEIYEVAIPLTRGARYYCSCTGKRTTWDCKHIAALLHLVKVVKWNFDQSQVSPDTS